MRRNRGGPGWSRYPLPDVLLARLQLCDILRQLLLLGGKLSLLGCKLLELLLHCGKLLLFGGQLLYAAPDERDILRQCLKLLRQFGRDRCWSSLRDRGWLRGRCCCLGDWGYSRGRGILIVLRLCGRNAVGLPGDRGADANQGHSGSGRQRENGSFAGPSPVTREGIICETGRPRYAD